MNSFREKLRESVERIEGPALRVRDELLRPVDDPSKRLNALNSLVGDEKPVAPSSVSPTPPAPEDNASSADRVIPFYKLPIKEQVWILMSNPNSSRAAQLIAGVIMFVIILSCVAMVVQTLPDYISSRSSVWSIIEYICVSVFTLELGLRLWSCPSKLSFFREPLNIIDILAILPVFVELIIANSSASSGTAIIRIIRLVRIFRVFKITRYLPWIRVFTNALLLSAQPLLMLLLMFSIAMVLFSSAIYYAERGEWNEEAGRWTRVLPSGDVETSPYQSIIASFWWCVVTMTTVGYGDNVPVTSIGRLIAAFASMSGILVLAIPVSIISTNFNSEFAKLVRNKEIVKARMHLLKKHFRFVLGLCAGGTLLTSQVCHSNHF